MRTVAESVQKSEKGVFFFFSSLEALKSLNFNIASQKKTPLKTNPMKGNKFKGIGCQMYNTLPEP